MPLNTRGSITALLSVRKGLEYCLLNEIKNSNVLRDIHRIRYKSGHLIEFTQESNAKNVKLLNGTSHIAGLENLDPCIPNKWRSLYPPSTQASKDSATKTSSIDTSKPVVVSEGDKIRLHLQQGGIECKCNWGWLLHAVLKLQSVESVWLRVGDPFRCHSPQDLEDNISKLPWNLHLPALDLDAIPLRVLSKHSRVWSTSSISASVKRGLKLYQQTQGTFLGAVGIKPADFCISITIARNTCYVAIQASGLLSPRLYNYCDSLGFYKRVNEIPHWSISGVVKQVQRERSREPESCTLKTENDNSNYQRRLAYIDRHVKATQDRLDVADATIGGLLNHRSVARHFDHSPCVIWNPLCSGGNLLCELIKLKLSLPNATAQQLEHLPVFKDVILGDDLTLFHKVIQDVYKDATRSQVKFEIIASDFDTTKLAHAKNRLLNLSSTFPHLLQEIDAKHVDYAPLPCLVHALEGLNLSVSLHRGDVHEFANHIQGALVIAKIPYVDFQDPKERKTSISLYKRFGQAIVSRIDWEGVYVISRGRAFEYYSGLEWSTVVKATSPLGDVVKLLRYTGKSRRFGNVHDSIIDLESGFGYADLDV